MCLYPKLIENRKYKANKKNGGGVTGFDGVGYAVVACPGAEPW